MHLFLTVMCIFMHICSLLMPLNHCSIHALWMLAWCYHAHYLDTYTLVCYVSFINLWWLMADYPCMCLKRLGFIYKLLPALDWASCMLIVAGIQCSGCWLAGWPDLADNLTSINTWAVCLACFGNSLCKERECQREGVFCSLLSFLLACLFGKKSDGFVPSLYTCAYVSSLIVFSFFPFSSLAF